MPRVNALIWLVFVWIGVIFLSSTSVAQQRCEQAYQFVSRVILGRTHPDLGAFSLLHLLADKGLHVTLFCVLAVLLWLSITTAARKPWLILLLGAVVGSLSEFLQSFFPDRDPAERDVLINLGGTALGLLLCLFSQRKRNKMTAPLQRSEHLR